MDRYEKRHIYDRRPQPRPSIMPKCWSDDDIEFWLTGDYDMSQESREVQIMLDLASELNAARVEWLMAGVRAAMHEREQGGYREPQHRSKLGVTRRGFDIHRE